MPLVETLLAWALLVAMVGIIAVRFWRGVQRGLNDEPPTTPAATNSRSNGPKNRAQSLMTIEQADRIVQSYAAVLQEESSAFGRPLTDLPAPVEDIKEALLLVAQWWHERGSLAPQRVSEFKASFGLLADFQPGGDGGFMEAVEHARRVLAAPSSTLEEKRTAASRLAVSDPGVLSASTAKMQTLFLEWDERWAAITGAPCKLG